MRFFFLISQVLLSGLIFYLDLNNSNDYSFGVLYCLIIVYSWVLPWKFVTEISGGVTTFLLISAVFITHQNNDSHINTLFSLMSIWIATAAISLAKNSIRNLEKIKKELDETVKNKTSELETSLNTTVKLINSIQDHIIISIDINGFILTWNEGLKKIHGYDAEEIIGRSHSIFYTEQDKKKDLPHKLLAETIESGYVEKQGWRVKKDGSLFYANTTLTSIYDSDKKLKGFTKITRDITALKELEILNRKQIILTSKNESLEQFAYYSSHNLQEPLRTIESYIEILFEDYMADLKPEAIEYFKTIANSTQMMRASIKGLLDFSRLMNESTTQTIDFEILIKQLLTGFEQQIKEYNCDIQIGKLYKMEGYLYPIQLLCSNLISNAIKFSRNNTNPKVEITSTINKKGILLIIKDNGIGIPQKYHRKIFELFVKLNPNHDFEGTGLGLAQCLKAVDLHNGQITVHSELDKGCEFHIFLPTSLNK